uniref:Uncharacterized protein n=1 Tax=Arundo donax TaxID=35708 RepID=A0A0A9H912_ARUDO
MLSKITFHRVLKHHIQEIARIKQDQNRNLSQFKELQDSSYSGNKMHLLHQPIWVRILVK